MEPLSWEYHDPNTRVWSEYVFDIYDRDLSGVLDRAEDISRFCPNYSNLNQKQKVNVWGMLISALVRYESFYDPLARYVEHSMGIDPITGKTIVSEGLLQLSYQDIIPFPFCDFNWEQDKNLPDKSPSKTILDPYRNLNCGMKILGRQIQRRGKIVLSKGAYWAVIKENSPHQRIRNIENWVKKLSFCSR
jgi:hypothetical protein